VSAVRVCDPPLAAGTPLAPGYVVEGHLSRNQVLDVYEVWSAERDCLCVIAGRKRDDAAPLLFVSQRLNLVRRAANLERARALQVLAFEEHLLAGDFIELARRDYRRAMNARGDALARRMD